MDRTIAWRAHPNAHGPASLMLAVHDQFRATSAHLMAMVAKGEPAIAIARVFRPFAQMLHHHHHAEEAMVFPLVHRRTGTAPDQLQTDHDAMSAAIDAAAASLTNPSSQLATAIAALHDILVTHLEREEDLVIPLFLELAPDELWRMFEHGR